MVTTTEVVFSDRLKEDVFLLNDQSLTGHSLARVSRRNLIESHNVNLALTVLKSVQQTRFLRQVDLPHPHLDLPRLHLPRLKLFHWYLTSLINRWKMKISIDIFPY